ncbi:zinc finger protein 555-like [Centruroides sculpturatus]|uniref:zinc finger protein 555-like n=1 Tax=Centruroides sculpturatus TaxID=218467 RepID=UPI000C6C8999|nr:zinc finger protein 555-like [Centruroides sculpturatus]
MEEKHQCPECSKTFRKKYHLNRHMQTHTCKKPFKCNICGKCFSDSSNLKRHLKLHSDEKPFNCNYEGCGWSFKLKHDLKRHVYRQHPQEILSKSSPDDPKIKSRTCDICGEFFESPFALRRHLISHTRERRYLCHFCNDAFRAKRSLNRHTRTFHPKEKIPSSCQDVRDNIKNVIHERKKTELNPCCSAAIHSEKARIQREQITFGMTSDTSHEIEDIHEDTTFETDVEPSTCFDLFPEVRIDRYELKCVLCQVKFDDEVSMQEHMKKYH